jgi:hypothetical protein
MLGAAITMPGLGGRWRFGAVVGHQVGQDKVFAQQRTHCTGSLWVANTVY